MSFSKYPRFGRGGGGRGAVRRPPPLGSSAIPSLSLNLAAVPTTVTTPPTPGPWDEGGEEEEEDQDEFDLDATRKRRRRRASVDDFALAPARLRGDAAEAAAPTEFAFLQDPPPGGGGPRVKEEKKCSPTATPLSPFP